MISRAIILYVQVCLGLTVAASLPLRSASAQNTVQQRIVTGYGLWNWDTYSIHGFLAVGSAVPDGRYYLHFTERNGTNEFDAEIEIIGGQPTQPDWFWFDSTYQARFVPDGGWRMAAVSAAPFGGGITLPASGEMTVSRIDTYYPDGNVPEAVHKVFDLNVLVGGGSTPTPSPTPEPSQSPTSGKPNDEHDGGTGSDGEDENTSVEPSWLDRIICSRGMARYTADLLSASLRITDTPLEYAAPVGTKIDFIISYRQRDADQSSTQQYSNIGPNWTFNWMSYVTDDPVNLAADAGVYVRGGGTELHSGFSSASQSYVPDPQSHAVLVRTSASTYEKRFPDGSKQVFGPASNGATAYPRLVFMTQAVDAIGNAVIIQYQPQSTRIDKIIDPLNQETTFLYENAADPYKITMVTDPFGRSVLLGYTNDQLTSATDPVGIVSQFTYQTGTNFIDSLTTPYGTTTFSTGEAGTNRWLNMVDPTGAVERVEYRNNAPGISDTDPPGTVPAGSGFVNASLDVRNTFFWDKKTLNLYPPVNGVYDYTKAKITHWLLSRDGLAPVATISSEKVPLENRVWYTYAGQPNYARIGATAQPHKIARVLGDGTTQLSKFEYNALGNVTKTIDPVGREFTNIYAANGIDLIEKRQTRGASNDLLASFTYNAQHLPLTSTDAAGQTTITTYNARGQKLTSQNPKSETTTYAYGGAVPDGYLASITGPQFNGASAVAQFTYDNAHRVQTTTDSDNYVLTFEYDDLDRQTKIIYPDGTFQESRYTDNVTGLMTLDVTGIRDRRGRWSYKHYNSNQQLDKVTDPAGRETLYDWCACGLLESITDAKNQTTTFHRDLQGRVYQKVFADNTTIDYLYEGQTAPNSAGATSRLQSTTDAKGQRTNYLYFPDNTVQETSYTDTAGQPLNPPTPTVSYTYNTKFSRVKTMTDGSGTTTYTYNQIESPPALGAGQLESIKGPLGHDKITFTYDELGRIVNRSIDGAANSDTWVFDSLGRVSSEVNNLGTFNYSYVGVTNRLNGMTYPGGQSTSYAYFPNAQDKRLQEIKNQTASGSPLSQFGYTYDAEGLIKTWTKSNPSLPAAQRSDFGYDNADQLLTAPVKDATTNALIKQYIYAYDLAGNRTSERFGNKTTIATPNNVNALVSQSGAINRTLTYDLNGSLTNDGASRTFEWDGANRLVAVNYTGTTNRSEFFYDGLNRCIKIVEKTGGVTHSTRKFVWCGTEKCEFRNANDGVTVRVYSQGQYSGGASYFYTRDHLGSVREMVDGSGTVVGRHDYDSYGQSTTVTGTNKPEFNFTGLYRHAKSNLDLAAYRVYDPDLGRWLSRDPAGEAGGLNLYGYSGNSPGNATDTLGLCPGDWWDLFEQFLYGAEEGAYASIDSAIPFWDPFSNHYSLDHAGVTFSYYVGGPALQTLMTAGATNFFSGAKNAVSEGTTVYRVWGDEASAWGRSWTTVDPRTLTNFRNVAGLPNQNSGRFISEGVLRNTQGVTSRTALPLHGNAGGLREIIVQNPASQIILRSVQGLNPGM